MQTSGFLSQPIQIASNRSSVGSSSQAKSNSTVEHALDQAHRSGVLPLMCARLAFVHTLITGSCSIRNTLFSTKGLEDRLTTVSPSMCDRILRVGTRLSLYALPVRCASSTVLPHEIKSDMPTSGVCLTIFIFVKPVKFPSAPAPTATRGKLKTKL